MSDPELAPNVGVSAAGGMPTPRNMVAVPLWAEAGLASTPSQIRATAVRIMRLHFSGVNWHDIVRSIRKQA